MMKINYDGTTGTTFTNTPFAVANNAIGIYPELYTSGETDINNLIPDGYLLVNPNMTSYNLEIAVGIANKGNNVASTDPQEAVITIPIPEGGFKPGYAYNIMIGLYAMQEVEVTATISDWEVADKIIDLPVE